MSWWRERVVPGLVERSCSTPVVRPARVHACQDVRGRVLAIGFGSGLDLPFLGRDVTEVLAVEPSDAAWRRSEPRRREAGIPVRRIGTDGARVSLDDGEVDAVLVTFTLCTVDDPDAVLREAHRLLAPAGALHLAEHGIAPDSSVVRWQRRLNGLQQRLAGGCRLTRDPVGSLERAGFATESLRAGYAEVPAPGRPWAYLVSGRSRPLR